MSGRGTCLGGGLPHGLFSKNSNNNNKFVFKEESLKEKSEAVDPGRLVDEQQAPGLLTRLPGRTLWASTRRRAHCRLFGFEMCKLRPETL